MKRLTLLSCVLLLSCGSDSSGPAQPDVSGTYTLRSYYAVPVPRTLSNGIEIVGGFVTLRTDLSWQSGLQLRVQGRDSALAANGTYSVRGDSIIIPQGTGFQYQGDTLIAGCVQPDAAAPMGCAVAQWLYRK